jgi:hypothetical protein
MSTQEREPRGDMVIEQKSSVKISTTAKGDAQVEVKVVEGTGEPELLRIEKLATDAYNRTRTAVAGGAS